MCFNISIIYDRIEQMKILAQNRRIKYDYEILETFEAGLELKGHEVKSVRQGSMSLRGAYVTIKANEAYLINAYISPYKLAANLTDYNPERPRKLLLHRKELRALIGKVKIKGLTLVPIRVYTKKSKIKLEFGVGKGRRKVDKRELIKKREAKRKMERMMKEMNT